MDNNNMTKLYNRLKPEVKQRLLTSNYKYKVSVAAIIEDLKSVNFYTELKMSTIHSLIVMSSTDPKDSFDLKWGDCFFNEFK